MCQDFIIFISNPNFPAAPGKRQSNCAAQGTNLGKYQVRGFVRAINLGLQLRRHTKAFCNDYHEGLTGVGNEPGWPKALWPGC